MDTATFSYSRWSAYLLLAAATIGATLAFALIAMGLHGLVILSGAYNVLDMSVLVGIGTWGLIGIWHWLRYAHILWTRYVLDKHGIKIESSHGSRDVAWADIDSAEYLPLFYTMRLHAATLRNPIVLAFGVQVPRFQSTAVAKVNLARELIESEMGGRLKKKWIP
jgi:hypothetical protein